MHGRPERCYTSPLVTGPPLATRKEGNEERVTDVGTQSDTDGWVCTGVTYLSELVESSSSGACVIPLHTRDIRTCDTRSGHSTNFDRYIRAQIHPGGVRYPSGDKDWGGRRVGWRGEWDGIGSRREGRVAKAVNNFRAGGKQTVHKPQRNSSRRRPAGLR